MLNNTFINTTPALNNAIVKYPNEPAIAAIVIELQEHYKQQLASLTKSCKYIQDYQEAVKLVNSIINLIKEAHPFDDHATKNIIIEPFTYLFGLLTDALLKQGYQPFLSLKGENNIDVIVSAKTTLSESV